jgi:hypothetical protein
MPVGGKLNSPGADVVTVTGTDADNNPGYRTATFAEVLLYNAYGAITLIWTGET